MALLGSQALGVLLAILVLMGVTVEGIRVSIGNFINPPIETMTVQCILDHKDRGTMEIKPAESVPFFVPMYFSGTCICAFSAPGFRTTYFDVLNTKCNCDTYSGCDWVARSDGFHCNHEFYYSWAH
ncbi:hypothetical protein M758_6G136300 [Ceratodon purpureus]|uniref:Uncharacterized protein n=1 Tax=Ceratodon purpureus TaxID=3225 RepID=A0A8T0HEF2_CERPU|nr:hypothetical protein KC19_6G141700 [Ceratodon purpureus]KAG0613881.1 hypothetical protein M758_6G136300 [Ceratodon purpureus]